MKGQAQPGPGAIEPTADTGRRPGAGLDRSPLRSGVSPQAFWPVPAGKYIVTHGTFSRAVAIAFSLWGAVMMLSSVMAYVHARARRIDRHRAWAIRRFAMVPGSWLFDIQRQQYFA